MIAPAEPLAEPSLPLSGAGRRGDRVAMGSSSAVAGSSAVNDDTLTRLEEES